MAVGNPPVCPDRTTREDGALSAGLVGCSSSPGRGGVVYGGVICSSTDTNIDDVN